MKNAYIYSFIAPPPSDFVDNDTSVPLLVIPVHLKDGRIWEIAILGSPSKIEAVRITIPNLPEEKIPPEDFERSVRLRTHALKCIKLTYDSDADYFRRGDQLLSMWNYIDTDRKPNFAVRISEPLNPDFKVNAESLKHLIAAPVELRPIIHLICDGSDPRLPMQFRFLSFYKIIELHYKVSPNKRFSDLLMPLLPECTRLFPELDSVASVCVLLNKFRKKCAHIRLTTGDVGFSHSDAKPDELFRAMEMIRRIAIRCVSSVYPNAPLQFASTQEEALTNWQQMENAGLRPIRVI